MEGAGGEDSAVQLSPEETRMLLQRLQTLEARVRRLERGNARAAIHSVASKVRSHLITTTARLRGSRPLPGLRMRKLSPNEAYEINTTDALEMDQRLYMLGQDLVRSTAKSSRAVAGKVSIVNNEVVSRVVAVGNLSWRTGGVFSNTTAWVGDRGVSAARSASAAVDLAVGKAVGAASVAIRSAETVVSDAAEIAFSDAAGTIPTPNSAPSLPFGSLQKPQTEQATVLQPTQPMQHSQRVVCCCFWLGATLGSLIAKIMGLNPAPLLVRGLAAGCISAYLCTLGNRLGKTVRLGGIIVLVLWDNMHLYVSERRREFEFVYRTGRWFEKIDKQLQRVETPSLDIEGVFSRIGSDMSLVTNAVSQSVGETFSGAFSSTANATGAAVDWLGSGGSWVQAQLKIPDAIGAVSHQIEKLQVEWFDPETEEGDSETELQERNELKEVVRKY